MNEFRLKYQYETGIQVNDAIESGDVADADVDDNDCVTMDISRWIPVKEYIEWLEDRLFVADQVNDINSLIIAKHGKNKTSKQPIHGPDQ